MTIALFNQIFLQWCAHEEILSIAGQDHGLTFSFKNVWQFEFSSDAAGCCWFPHKPVPGRGGERQTPSSFASSQSRQPSQRCCLPNVTKLSNVQMGNALEAPFSPSDAALGCHPNLVAPLAYPQQPKRHKCFQKTSTI